MLLAQFLVPRKPARTPRILQAFHAALLDRFGGYTLGPVVTGAWRNGRGEVEHDSLDAYMVGIPDDAEKSLTGLLAALAADIRESAIWATFTHVSGGCIDAAPVEREVAHA